MPSQYFIEIATILLNKLAPPLAIKPHPSINFFSAPDDVSQPDEVRALIKDISDIRAAKLRKGIVNMVSKQATYGKVLL